MTGRTRYFVIASVLVLGIGLGTGLLAYYVGQSGSAPTGSLDELRFIPRNAAVVAFANVQDVMHSDVRQRIRRTMPSENGQREFEERTGINVETDIDRVVACLDPQPNGAPQSGTLVLARGRFNEVKIEALMRDRGASVEDYKGKRLIVAPAGAQGSDFGVAFIEPGLAAVGSARLVRAAVDLQHGGENVTANQELMGLIRSLDSANAWAVGNFEALRASTRLPEGLAQRIPPITLFSLSGHIDGGVTGVLRAEAKDDDAANSLRDVVRGFLALAKLQAGSDPKLQAVLQSLELGGAGKAVALSFTVPGEVFDGLPVPRPRRGLQNGH